jgi:urea transport system ATP-binding protein
MSQTILDLDDVSVSFDGFYALTDLSFSLRPGELRSIIGPNGAGKTTFLDVITGKVRPTKGDVMLRGRSIVGLSEQKISRLGVGRKFQTPRVFENLTVQRNLELTASPKKNPLSLLTESLNDAVKDEVFKIMEYVGLAPYAKWQAGSLSHGQKQWLAISMLVAQSPDIILLDEPVAGLTDEETSKTADLIKSLAGEHTVVVIEHDMEFIRELGAPVTVLHQGQKLIDADKVAVVFGGWTSASRKAMLPVYEAKDHFLFYPIQYEGQECSKNIFYTGAVPNQQAEPAVDWLFDTFADKYGKKVYLVGSDYVYPRTAVGALPSAGAATAAAAADCLPSAAASGGRSSAALEQWCGCGYGSACPC